MGQQEYDAFREQMKQWMLDNSDIYDEFEEMMNSQSDMGVQQIMAQAMMLIPEYGKLISKKINSGNADDVADVEEAFEKANLAEELVSQFGKASTVPAMICWLFYGRSYETMVENLERIVKDPTQNQSDKLFATQAIKLVIEQSIISGIRTAEDWSKYGNLRDIANNNNAFEWALSNLEEQDEEATPLHRPEQVSALESMILLDGEKKKILLNKIGEYINTGVKGKCVAFMILALRGLGYLPEITSDRQLEAEKLNKEANSIKNK